MEHDPHNAQNWCPDPIGGHEARWFSDGLPTALVRDHGVEAQDPPPETAVGHRWELPSIVPERTESPPTAPTRGHHRFGRHRSRAAAD